MSMEEYLEVAEKAVINSCASEAAKLLEFLNKRRCLRL